MSFDNVDQVLELSTPVCSTTPLLIDYGLEASVPFDINTVSNVDKLSEKLRVMRPSIVLLNHLGIEKNNLGSRLWKITSELHEYVKDTGFILVVLDSVIPPVLTKNAKTKLKELKNVEEHVFHPGGNSHHYCNMLTNLPSVYAQYPLAQTSDRTKNRLAISAVKLRESIKSAIQEQVYSVSYKITTDDKFLQSLTRSIDALPARTEANLEAIKGRAAEVFKTSVLYARWKLIPRLLLQTSVIYRARVEEKCH